ncbi:transposase [Paenibacillus sp. ALJ109b]|uniref:transposase n=1 Tax=Paenibacillus sp. ALJ109b TaxID=2709068 RepID=UPI0013D63FA6|nr:transposase [Paenibacillus sp. ALJ109b]NEU60519.1 hypothetical protein [Paenibacillus sp. ALJ109b]
MEDVLETYALPYDPEIPLICMDEQPIQLLDHSRPPQTMKPGQVLREDYEYVRKGSCSLFLFTEPLAGWRHVQASEKRTKSDWALQIQELLEIHYPEAKRLEIHYAPKHGSWLNIAEIEFSVLTIQCLNPQIASIRIASRGIGLGN